MGQRANGISATVSSVAILTLYGNVDCTFVGISAIASYRTGTKNASCTFDDGALKADGPCEPIATGQTFKVEAFSDIEGPAGGTVDTGPGMGIGVGKAARKPLSFRTRRGLMIRSRS